MGSEYWDHSLRKIIKKYMSPTQLLKKAQAVVSIVEYEMLWTSQRQGRQRNVATYVVPKGIVTRGVQRCLHRTVLKLGLWEIPLMEQYRPSNLPQRVMHARDDLYHHDLGTIEFYACLSTAVYCFEVMGSNL